MLYLPLQELRERVLRGKYRIPFYMSTDCENLLKKFLVLNPSKRMNLEVKCGHDACMHTIHKYVQAVKYEHICRYLHTYMYAYIIGCLLVANNRLVGLEVPLPVPPSLDL